MFALVLRLANANAGWLPVCRPQQTKLSYFRDITSITIKRRVCCSAGPLIRLFICSFGLEITWNRCCWVRFWPASGFSSTVTDQAKLSVLTLGYSRALHERAREGERREVYVHSYRQTDSDTYVHPVGYGCGISKLCCRGNTKFHAPQF